MTIEAILAGKGDNVWCVECGTPVRDAVASLAEKRIGAVPVMKDGKVVGIMSERDVIYALQRQGAGMLDATVETIMSSPAVTVALDFKVMAALALMTQRRMRHLPVVQDGQLIGLVSIGDLVKYRTDRIEREAEEMRSYIQSA